MNNTSVVITGCAGFIGSHAVDYFLELGYNVVGIDCLTYAGNLKNLENARRSKNFIFKILDICEIEAIKSLVIHHDCSWIINFAAETHVDNSIESVGKFIHSNIIGVKSLLEVCRITGRKLLQVSTDEVYGSTLAESFNENDKLNPQNPYSATKAAGEHLIMAYENTHKINYVIVRPSNNFGPRQHGEKFLPTIIRKIKNNEKIPVYGNGKNIRDWLYVKNNVKMIEKILQSGQLNEIYNLTNDNEMENLAIIKKIMSILEKDFESNIEFIKDRPGHDFRYSISSNKLETSNLLMSSKFETDLKTTIHELWNAEIESDV